MSMSKWLKRLSRSSEPRASPNPPPRIEAPEPASPHRKPNLYAGSISADSIRILTLLPGTWEDPIRTELRITGLSKPGSYSALSYTWNTGDNDDQLMEITCNDLPISISYNLYLALQQLRDRDFPFRLWIDALCINQKDDSERTRQVGIMRKIYEQSLEVVIWLGAAKPGEHLGHLILPMLPEEEKLNLYTWRGDGRDVPKLKAYMSAEVTAIREEHLDMPDVFGAFRVMHALLHGVEASDLQDLRHFSKTGPILKGFDVLLKQRWWSRAWIVQEVVVAKHATIRYGQLSAPWKLFAHAALQYEKGRLEAHADSMYPYLEQQSLRQFSQKILEIETTRNEWHSIEPTGLLPLLRKFRSRSATDERDRVFALLGLVRFWRVKERSFAPDYSLTTKDVAFQTTKSLLASYGSVSVLAGTLRESERHDTNPSWVFNLSCPPQLFEDTRLENIVWYSAGGSNGLIELHKQRILKVEGVYLDEVISVGDELVDTTIARVRLVVQDWIDLWLGTQCPQASLSIYVGGGTASDAFWRTVCGSMEFSQFRDLRPTGKGKSYYVEVKGFRRATEEGASAFEQFRSTDYSYRRNTSIIAGFWQESRETNISLARGTAFLHAIVCASAGRRFFVTKRGYIGMGPRNIALGDSAFVIAGSQVPFILRKSRTTDSCGGALIETLNAALSPTAQPLYVRAGRDAVAPVTQKYCDETHDDSYFLVGDAYVHGVMDREFAHHETRQSIFLV